MRSSAAQAGSAAVEEAPPGPQEAPLSFAQQRLWFLDRLGAARSAYNVPYRIRMKGALDVEALRRSLAEIVRRHATLRTTFPEREGQPLQVVHADAPVALRVEDLSALSPEESARRAAEAAREEAHRSFDLAEGPLFSARLLRRAEAEHELLLTFHHIVYDGWSEGVLLEELSALYGAFREGRPSPLPELPASYAQLAASERERLSGSALDADLAYWKEALAGAPTSLELPADFPRPAVQTSRGALHPVSIAPDVADALRAFGKREHASAFMTHLTAFAVLLARHAHQDDLLIGCPIAGRERPESAPLIGLFANTIVLRARLDGDPSFRDLVCRVRETALDAYEHQELPFERLVGEIAPERSLARSPLFQASFALQTPSAAPSLPGLDVTVEQIAVADTAKFDLSLYLIDAPGRLEGWFEYATDLFRPETIERLAERFAMLLSAIAAAPDTRVSELPILPRAERALVTTAWNATEAEIPEETALELFEAQAKRRPDAPALASSGRRLTYGELDAEAERLSRALRARGAGPESAVAVLAHRSPELVVAALAAWKAGAAYVPLDPSAPPARLAAVAHDAGASLVLVEPALADRLPAGTAEVLVVGRTPEPASAPPPRRPSPRDLAYVVFTSGSTGTPKGVEVEHRALANLLAWHLRAYELTDRDRTTLIASPAFDASVWEIWPTLAAGASLHIPDGEVKDDPAALLRWLAAERITVSFLPTPLAETVLEEPLPQGLALRALLVGGDRLHRAPDRPLPFRLVNHYGPTESTVVATAGDVAAGEALPSIGRPIANTKAFVLDARRQPVPIGVAGELFLGGASLARGYRGRPDLTAERFVDAPFPEAGGRLYATGDRARFRADGTLEFLSRVDDQVKVRGIRIEPAEVEAALARHPDVRECAVAARGEGRDARLVAYVVPRTEPGPETAELKRHLAQSLPEPFVPSSFVTLRALPLTPTGKVNRAALPAPTAPPARLVEPRDEVEARLAALFAEQLGRTRVGVEDDYFELGGHSLMAARLFARIEREFGRKLPLATIFQAPTVALLAELLRAPSFEPSWSSLVPIQPKGTLPPFYCVHAAGGNVLTYFDLSRRLGEDQPVYGLQAQGLDGRTPLPSTLEEMAARYIAEIRAFQPKGPYYVGGSSAGGMVAFEMAQQLRAEGEDVGLLALFDTWGPDYRALPMSPARVRLARFVERVDLHTGNFLVSEGAKEKLAYVVTKSRRLGKDVVKNTRRAAKRARERLFSPLPKHLRRVESANRRAVDEYVPKPYAGVITLFRATKQPAGYELDPSLGWGRIAAGGVEVFEVPGYHGAIVYEPRVALLAEKLAHALAAARASARESPPRRMAI